MFNQQQHVMKRLFSLPAIGLLLTFLLANRIATAQTFFTAEVVGKGKPMILIHGLYCNGDVWKETVDRYKNDYECHILTLAGFGGNTPNLNDHLLESVTNDVIGYIKTKKLKKPVVMGHSMGAFLSFWIAASGPGLIDKVIAVDGAPFLAALAMPGATSESAKPMALNMKNGMADQTPEQVYEYQKNNLPYMITSPERVLQVAEIAKKADSKTQAEVMYELFTIDLRQKVASIDCPVLVLGAWIAYKGYGATHDSVLKNNTEQLALVKNAKVELNDTAKHFIFYDDPQWFYEKVDGFLKSTK
jgi:pimeloyl-ACP methyl ester carboxylesterase